MTRKQPVDTRRFNKKEDIERISSRFQQHRYEVRMFLRAQSGAGMLQGLSNEQVYELIRKELGFSAPI